MKKSDPSQPYVQPHWPHYVMIGMFGCGAVFMLTLFIHAALTVSMSGMLATAFIFLMCMAMILLFRLSMYPRYTITMEGIEFHHKRKNWHMLIPWSDFTHMYAMTGSKSTHIMFANRLMDKPAQYAALKAYRFRREHPVSPDGCLVLHGEPSEIIARIPAYVEQVPDWKCCSFWDGYLLL